MNRISRLISTLLVLVLAAPVLAQSVAGYIQDDAALFSPSAIQDANQRIDVLQDRTHVTFWVRTLKKLPDELAQELRDKSTKVQIQTFRKFALDQAESEGRRGIYVLISHVPNHKHVMIVVTPVEIENLFSKADAEAVRLIFASGLGRRPDQALAEAVEKVQHLLFNRSESTSVGWPLIGSIVCGLLGLWMLLGLLRMRMNDPNTPANSAEPTARRNSLVGGLLGGMFGAVAGHWIYDTLFSRDKTAPEPPPPPGTNPLDDRLDQDETAPRQSTETGSKT